MALVPPARGSSLDAASQLDESLPMRLEGSLAEKKVWADLAELYSVLQATEHLETAFVSDAIPTDVYNAQCNKWVPVRTCTVLSQRCEYGTSTWDASRFRGHHLSGRTHAPSGLDRFLGQFKLLEDALKGTFESVELFMTRYSIRLPQAYKRLVVDRVPATAMN